MAGIYMMIVMQKARCIWTTGGTLQFHNQSPDG
jgi:hypothetical protein